MRLRKKKLKSLIRFHGASKINKIGNKRQEKTPKESTEQVKA